MVFAYSRLVKCYECIVNSNYTAFTKASPPRRLPLAAGQPSDRFSCATALIRPEVKVPSWDERSVIDSKRRAPTFSRMPIWAVALSERHQSTATLEAAIRKGRWAAAVPTLAEIRQSTLPIFAEICLD